MKAATITKIRQRCVELAQDVMSEAKRELSEITEGGGDPEALAERVVQSADRACADILHLLAVFEQHHI